MILNKKKSLITVFVLFLFVGFLSVGCNQKTTASWVNTSSMPGRTFSKKIKKNSNKVLYMGSERNSENIYFGPEEVNFDLKIIKKFNF